MKSFLDVVERPKLIWSLVILFILDGLTTYISLTLFSPFIVERNPILVYVIESTSLFVGISLFTAYPIIGVFLFDWAFFKEREWYPPYIYKVSYIVLLIVLAFYIFVIVNNLKNLFDVISIGAL